MIQVKENVFVDKERFAFYQENNFTQLFDISDEIDKKIELIDILISKSIENQTAEIDNLQNENAKQQWYSDTLISLCQINQALFYVIDVLNEKYEETK